MTQATSADDSARRAFVLAAEREIDAAFAQNPLMRSGAKQAIWTILSVAEDAFLKNTELNPLPIEQIHVLVDSMINELAYPIRACFKHSPSLEGRLDRKLINGHYAHAVKWLEDAESYGQFNSIFPLWRRGLIALDTNGKNLVTPEPGCQHFEYEAYNRLVRKEARRELADEDVHLVEPPRAELLARTTCSANTFDLKFDRKLVERLIEFQRARVTHRHTLPADWQFDGFTLGEFREVVTTIQAFLTGWQAARVIAAGRGIVGLGYDRAVWMLNRDEIQRMIECFSGLPRDVVGAVLSALTYGNGYREPDIVLQPLVQFADRTCALSPFVWLNSNSERNMSVLLNAMPAQRKHWTRLTQQKETVLREELLAYLESSDLGLDYRQGKLADTDLDLAILDRANRVCLCLELKWFLEPAEIREIVERTEEIQKGILQAKKLTAAFAAQDERLFRLLDIDATWGFQSAVGSVNWIGHDSAQEPEVPVIKVWHLMRRIRNGRGLSQAIDWLRNRGYLPVLGADFSIGSIDIANAGWKSSWYGIAPLRSFDGGAGPA